MPKSEREKPASAAAEGEDVPRKGIKRKEPSGSTGEAALMKASKKAKGAQELVKTDSSRTKSSTVKPAEKNPAPAKPAPSFDASESSEEDSEEDTPAPKKQKKPPT